MDYLVSKIRITCTPELFPTVQALFLQVNTITVSSGLTILHWIDLVLQDIGNLSAPQTLRVCFAYYFVKREGLILLQCQ